MNVDGHYSKLRLFKAWKFWIFETSAQYKLCRKTFTVSTMSHMSSKKHSNAAGQSSRGSSCKGRMQLTSYLWKKNWNAMEKLWKSYGISFLGICTNPACKTWLWLADCVKTSLRLYLFFYLCLVRQKLIPGKARDPLKSQSEIPDHQSHPLVFPSSYFFNFFFCLTEKPSWSIEVMFHLQLGLNSSGKRGR